MKKLILVLKIFFLCLLIQANPRPSPTITITELYFDKNNDWVMELNFSDFENQKISFRDSFIAITSSKDTGYLKKFVLKENQDYIVITKDSLLSKLIINPEGDSIKIISTYGFYTDRESLVYGNYKNSLLTKPKTGESLSRHNLGWRWNSISPFSIDNSPTPGIENDTTGMCGTLKGKIYDMYDNLITEQFSLFFSFPLLIDKFGNYQTRVYSNKNSTHTVWYNMDYYTSLFFIDTISYSMKPDSVVSRDIHIHLDLDSIKRIFTNIKYFNNNSILKIFPNPIFTSHLLNYELSLPVISTNCHLELININGRKIKNFQITNNAGSLEISDIKNGFYILQLLLNNKKVFSTQIIVKRDD